MTQHTEHHSAHEDHSGHEAHSGHGGSHGAHQHGGPGSVSWPMAAKATLHCLLGCALGEILGMVIGTALAWHNAPTMALAIVLAFAFGYSFTMYAVVRAGLDLRTAFKVALAADTVSILVMELVDNGVVLLVPGAMDAHVDTGLFWGSLAVAFAIAFVITTPVNRVLIGAGKGHAVVHQYHH